MFLTVILLVLSCFVFGVPAPGGHGGSMMCRTCHHVSDPRLCTEYEACHESCVTDVYYLNGMYSFTYSCKPHLECGDDDGPLGKRQLFGPHGHGHEHGQHVCRECCRSTGCDSQTCSKYFSRTTTPVPVTTTPVTTTTVSDNRCRDYESPTFQCAEFERYNFCTDTTSVAYALAHEKCAKHCGFCSPYGTVKPYPVAVASTTTKPVDFTATRVAMTPVAVVVNITQPFDPNVCVDNDDPSLSCADLENFGFCSPDSGAGYSLVQLRCRKTCKLC